MKHLITLLSFVFIGSFTANPAFATSCSSQLIARLSLGQCENGICSNECNFDSNCPQGKRCDRDHGNTCVNGSTGWPDCNSDLDCPFSHRCVDGLCRGNFTEHQKE